MSERVALETIFEDLTEIEHALKSVPNCGLLNVSVKIFAKSMDDRLKECQTREEND